MLRQVTCSLSPAHPSFRCLSLHEPLIFHHRFFQKEKSQSQKNYDSLKKNAPKADFDCKALLSAERLLEILTRAATLYPGRARLCACVLVCCVRILLIPVLLLTFSLTLFLPASLAAVTSFNISRNNILLHHLPTLQAFIPKFTNIEKLNISYNPALGCKGVVALLSSLTGTQCCARRCTVK
jgi:hypothetical protein